MSIQWWWWCFDGWWWALYRRVFDRRWCLRVVVLWHSWVCLERWRGAHWWWCFRGSVGVDSLSLVRCEVEVVKERDVSHVAYPVVVAVGSWVNLHDIVEHSSPDASGFVLGEVGVVQSVCA